MNITLMFISSAIVAVSGLMGYLVYAADNGSITAIVILTVVSLIAFTLALTGSMALILRSAKQSDKEMFEGAIKEKIATVLSMQGTQNLLSEGMAKQASHYQKQLNAVNPNGKEPEFSLSEDNFFSSIS